MWALSSLIRDQTQIVRQILNYWTTREIPEYIVNIAQNYFLYGFALPSSDLISSRPYN